MTGAAPRQDTEGAAPPGRERVVTVHVGDAEHALSLGNVIEVVRMVEVAPVPDAPAWLAGAVDVRGELLPVVDLRTRLGHPRREPDPGMVLVLAATPDGPVALCADAVGTLEDVEIGGASEGAEGPVVRADGRLVTRLDPAALGADARRWVGPA